MLRQITRIITAVLREPQFIDLAKNIGNIQVIENETHIVFFLNKNNHANSGVIRNLKKMIPEAMIFTTNEGMPFLNIEVKPEITEKIRKEASKLGGEGEKTG